MSEEKIYKNEEIISYDDYDDQNETWQEYMSTCHIKDDMQANRFVKSAKMREANLDRQIELAKAEIEELKKHIAELEEAKTKGFYRNQLYLYYNTKSDDEMKRTKTQSKYELTYGSIVRKYGGYKAERTDESKIIEWAQQSAPECVENVPKLKWAELKKDCIIDGNGCVYKPTGEIVEGIEVVQTPDTFDLKFNDIGGADNV